MRLLIGVPTLDYVNADFVKCLTRLLMKLKDENVDFDLMIESGTLVYIARERIARKAMGEQFTHILWLDSDMIFHEDILDSLMRSGKDLVTGIYQARRKGYGSCIFKSIEPETGSDRFEEYPEELFQIAACGFGCVLTSVYLISNVYLHYNTCFTPLPWLGEDIAFCKRASKLGFKLWCEPSVVCGHIGLTPIYPEDRKAFLKVLNS